MDISSLRERTNNSELSVSELNNYVKALFDSDRSLRALSVRGEISNLTKHGSGHIYFTLKDEGAQVRAVMFRSNAAGLKFEIENGMKVIVRCSVGVYTQGGSYQLYVTSIQPDGVGALYLAYEQLKNKLSVEGLFNLEHKLPIPRIPTSIGVITSPTGAAIRDIINVLKRRFPMSKVYLYPALVQGEGAEKSLLSGIDYFDKSKLADVIIIGRGGGSIEDLWAFNSEMLARRIYDCRVPVISAVGHEVDFTICDFVADMRAPTPSAAAELAVPSADELKTMLKTARVRCVSSLKATLRGMVDELEFQKSRSLFREPERIFDEEELLLSDIKDKLSCALEESLDRVRESLALTAQKLNAISPLSVLGRGYAVVTGKSGVLKDSENIDINDDITVRLQKGTVFAKVQGKVK